MEDNNNEEIDASQAMLKARKQAQALTKDKREKPKKGGAILHVNNYQSGIPEAKCNMAKNAHFPQNLKPGYVVRSKGTASAENTFIVEAKLAPRVYMVRNHKTDKFCSLKIEPYYNEGDVKQLKRDVFILLGAVKQDSRFNLHFPKIVSKGRVAEQFNYIVTTLCDFNMDDLREKVIKGDFSPQTAARLTMQSFQAVHDLHTLGYIHRDISPSKFMMGLENPTLIYMGGFSTAYHFKKKDGRESPSTKKLHRMAKIRFLPRAYHRFKDLDRFDDLESWLYTAIDFFGRKLLPWDDSFDESQITASKDRFFFGSFEEIFTYAPKQLQVILRYIEKNDDDGKPNYTFLGITLVGMRDKLKFPYTGPFDFQLGSKAPKHPKKPTREDKLPEDTEGPSVAPTSTAMKNKKKSGKAAAAAHVPSTSPPPPAGDDVFEDGDGEAPQEENKPALNADRAMSMARKKKQPGKSVAAKAAQAELEDGGGNQSALKPVNPDVIKGMKKKKAATPTPVVPAPVDDEEEEDGSDAENKAPPPPPPVSTTPKKSRASKKGNKKKGPTTPSAPEKSNAEKASEVGAAAATTPAEAENEKGGDNEKDDKEDKDDGNDGKEKETKPEKIINSEYLS